MIGGASEKAVRAAQHAVPMGALTVLEAAHDPALGLDRSVSLRAAIEVLREEGLHLAADVLERDLGGVAW